MRRTALVTLLALAWVVATQPAWSKKQSAGVPRFMEAPRPAALPPDIQSRVQTSSLKSAAADTFHLAWFSFDSFGSATPQGWVAVDPTKQLDSFFHVAGPVELDGGQFGNLLALQGAQSMWCGTLPSAADPFCGWTTLPGYGNSWDQILLSKPLACDSIRLSYKVWWDSEDGYDFTDVEYFDQAGGQWVMLPVDSGAGRYHMKGLLTESFAVPIAAGTTQLRFRFTSDGAWSDEDGLWPTDGAVIVDSITVECFNGGVLTQTLFEDFEGETPGSRVTTDSCWTGTVPAGAGQFADLYPGSSVMQEGECFFNISHLWGFFDDPAVANYACHLPDPRPDQGAIPFGAGDGIYVDNEIWSPRIPVTGAGDDYTLRFKVYRDLPLDNLVFYTWSWRSWVTNCPEDWQDFDFVWFSGSRDWLFQVADISSLVAPGVAELQIALGVADLCGVWCNVFGSGTCHSHGPLYDDVHLDRVNVVGPRFFVRHLDLFQDNFAEDGTLTGAARADAANDVAPSISPTLLPGDSIMVTVTDPQAGLGTDAVTGVGPAVYLYASVWPPNQPGKTGPDLEAPETRAVGKRYPLVDSLVHNGVKWYCFRGDSALTNSGFPIADRFCFDLNDAVFTPGDTICYVLSAENTNLVRSYWSRTLNGQGTNFVTGDQAQVLDSPLEFTILPAAGTLPGNDILYVDDTDDRGGPAQLFFDTAFDWLALRDRIDRYDVLGPSSSVGNSLASRVKSVSTQIMGPYRKIIWNSGTLSGGLIGDGGSTSGGSGPEKSDDFALLFQFLDTHPNAPGLYVSADDIGAEWVNLTGAGAIGLRSIYMNFNLDPASTFGDHISAGEPVSPTLTGVGPALGGDQLVAFGGCPFINDFDLLQPTGLSAAELNNAGTGRTYSLSQATPNAVASTARVVLSGFSYHNIRDVGTPGLVPARVAHLEHILQWLQNIVPVPSGFEETPQLVNNLEANYPNPFNPTTTIAYEIKDPGHVSLKIYNAAGRLVKTLVNEVQTPRPEGFEVTWDGLNNAGQTVSSGVYFYKMLTKGFSQTKKMVLLK